jgi:chemotaxis protein CheZ
MSTDTQQPLTRVEIASIVADVLAGMTAEPGQTGVGLYRELGALAQYIRQARDEIAAIRPDEITGTHIPSATDELDAVVGATEAATNQIMDAAESLSTLAGKLSAEASAEINDTVSKIYEACSFQDITGQRITKVVRTLKHIENKVEALLRAFGEGVAADAAAQGPIDPADESALLNGPQLPGKAIDQAEIDRLFGD